MRYRSTSREAPLTSLRGAVLRGLAPDGGLYMPVEIARRTPEELEEFRRLPFTEVCFRVVRPFAAAGCPRRSDVADRQRSHQFSRKARLALAGLAHSRAVSRPHAGLQGFWRAIHGAPDGLLRSRRNPPANRAGRHFRRHRQRRSARFSARPGHSRGDSLSFETHQRSPGKTIHHARRKYHCAGSPGSLRRLPAPGQTGFRDVELNQARLPHVRQLHQYRPPACRKCSITWPPTASCRWRPCR